MKALLVARVGPAQPHAPVAALVEEGPDRAVLLAHDEHGILAHVGREEVARLGDHRVVGQEEPRPAEDPFQLEFVDLLVAVDERADGALLGVDQRGQVDGHQVFPPGLPNRGRRARRRPRRSCLPARRRLCAARPRAGSPSPTRRSAWRPARRGGETSRRRRSSRATATNRPTNGSRSRTGRTTSSATSMAANVSMPVSMPSRSHTAASTSVGVLPAPAPIPQVDASTQVAPARTAAIELATPRSRFMWPWKPTSTSDGTARRGSPRPAPRPPGRGGRRPSRSRRRPRRRRRP